MISIYLHIPFCMQKCPYCDFSSFDDKAYLIDDYIKAMGVELKYYTDNFAGRLNLESHKRSLADNLLAQAAEAQAKEGTVPSEAAKLIRTNTLYIGGGTPSFLSFRQLDALFTEIYTHFPRPGFREVTIEVNPETLSENKAKVIALNVNRASLGCQSFDDALLKTLGRPHNAERARRAAEDLKKFGVTNLNIDLIFGIPGQTAEGVASDIREAVKLGAGHISFYSLTAYEHTPFFERRNELPSDDKSEELYNAGCAELKAHGFEHYEISNFAKPGARCRHNMAYWNLDEYIGIGTAASSFFDGKRYTNIRDIERYVKLMKIPDDPAETCEETDNEKMLKEHIMLKLRTAEGISYADFKARFGFEFADRYSKIIGKYAGSVYAQAEEEGFKLTEKGFFVSNSIISSFF